MAEDADYTPGAWTGHSFADAKRFYADHAGRDYRDAAAKVADGTLKATDLVPARIATESLSPLVIACDVTGSFGTWPQVIFSKLPYLDLEGKEYLGADMEISFCAVGDTTSDNFPLQVQRFGSGPPLKDNLSALKIEGGGGGGSCESYEIAALYYARNVDMPNAVKPVLVFIADEAPYAVVTRTAAKSAKVDLERDIGVDQVFAELKARFSVYLVHKPYTVGNTRAEWVRLLGEDRIADLQDPERVVDVIFGLLARETGRVDYFRKEIEARQGGATDPKVKTVYRALHTVHAIADKSSPVGSKSTLHRPTGGAKAKGLLE